jgi:WD40-like Beta Propeller Repeat
VIELVSVGAGGVPADAFAPSISADGDKVVFYSDASNLAPDFPSRGDVFVHDRSAGTTVAVSRAFNPGGTTDVGSGAISGDGSTIWFTGSAAIGSLFGAAHVVYDLSPSLGDGEFVAYTSDSDAIVPGDADGTTDVLVRAVHVPRVLSATPSVVARGTSATLTVVG